MSDDYEATPLPLPFPLVGLPLSSRGLPLPFTFDGSSSSRGLFLPALEAVPVPLSFGFWFSAPLPIFQSGNFFRQALLPLSRYSSLVTSLLADCSDDAKDKADRYASVMGLNHQRIYESKARHKGTRLLVRFVDNNFGLNRG